MWRKHRTGLDATDLHFLVITQAVKLICFVICGVSLTQTSPAVTPRARIGQHSRRAYGGGNGL